MQLIIAEKPSLGRAIAQVLPTPHTLKHGYIECGQETIVTWCHGHLLEPFEPEGYKPQWARWNLTELPILPDTWKLTPRSDTLQQLRVIGTLLESADSIVHAGDPDREGQLLVDEVINYFDVTLPVQRLLVNDLTPRAISLALNQLTENTHYKNLFLSAQSRQKADWLYGINLTRAITLMARKNGNEGVYSVGRVQTPILGLIVKRDLEIAQFESIRHFTVDATFTGTGISTGIESSSLENKSTVNNAAEFSGQWKVSLSREIHCDTQKRLLNRKIAERVVQKVSPISTNTTTNTNTNTNKDKPIEGHVIKVTDTENKEPAPLPFSLSTLQIEASKRYRYSAQSVLDSCQMLYENYQLITYPRSDCRFLPEGHFERHHDVLNIIAGNSPSLIYEIQQCDPLIKSRAWDNKKVGAHHAIIPTEHHYDISTLHEREQNVYLLICQYYIAQFHPDLITDESTIEIMVANEIFHGHGSTIRQPGWQSIFKSTSRDGLIEATPNVSLPALREGELVQCLQAKVINHSTVPPDHFTDATLLFAITNIAHFVEDSDIRRTLRDTDGLGTESTRASIIETLYKRNYAVKNAQFILATEKGRHLIEALPPACTKPDMTATWEATLNTISTGSTTPKEFSDRLTNEIERLIEHLTGISTPKQSTVKSTVSQPPTCPKCQSEMLERIGKFGRFWACSQFPDCKSSLPWKLNTTRKAKSVQTGDSPPIPCPNCHAPLVRRTGTRGPFWGCSNYPSCRQSFKDIEGKPQIPINPRR